MHEFRQNFCDCPKITQDLRHNGNPAPNRRAAFDRQGGRRSNDEKGVFSLGHSLRRAGITQIQNKAITNNKQSFLNVFFISQNLSLTVYRLSHIMIAMSAPGGNSTVPVSKKAPATDSIPHIRSFSPDYSFVGCSVELFAAGRTVQPLLRSSIGWFAVRFSTVQALIPVTSQVSFSFMYVKENSVYG